MVRSAERMWSRKGKIVFLAAGKQNTPVDDENKLLPLEERDTPT